MTDETKAEIEAERTRLSRRSLITFGMAIMLGAALAVVISASTTLIESGSPAPAFQLTTADGNRQVSLESLRGKIVIIDFWSTTCPPCVTQLRELEQIHQQVDAEDVVILGINTEGAPPQLVSQFARDRGVRYTVLVDEGAVSTQYRVERLPTLYLIDREGRVQWSRVGYASQEELSEVIREHI